MTTRTLLVLPLLAALAACEGATNASLCTPFTKTGAAADTAAPAPPGAPGAEAAAFDDCLHRWAYRLAASTDTAEAVANATLAACGEALSRWNTQVVNQDGGDAPAIDLQTGRTISTLEQRYEYARGKSLFYVVQGRAGKCRPPAA